MKQDAYQELEIKLLKESVEQLKIHAQNSNQEVGIIKEDIKIIQNDIKWIVKAVEKIDAKFWWIITTIIVSVIIPLIK